MAVIGRRLEPLAICRCGKAAAFACITTEEVAAGYNRSSTYRERQVNKCVECAEKLVRGIGRQKFTPGNESIPVD